MKSIYIPNIKFIYLTQLFPEREIHPLLEKYFQRIFDNQQYLIFNIYFFLNFKKNFIFYFKNILQSNTLKYTLFKLKKLKNNLQNNLQKIFIRNLHLSTFLS